jgi:hypothetical protein
MIAQRINRIAYAVSLHFDVLPPKESQPIPVPFQTTAAGARK